MQIYLCKLDWFVFQSQRGWFLDELIFGMWFRWIKLSLETDQQSEDTDVMNFGI